MGFWIDYELFYKLGVFLKLNKNDNLVLYNLGYNEGSFEEKYMSLYLRI